MRVNVQLGPAFSREAGFSERVFALQAGATAETLLRAIARAAPGLSCVDEAAGAVDLATANLSVNGRGVDPRSPEKTALRDGDRAYLYGVIAGG